MLIGELEMANNFLPDQNKQANGYVSNQLAFICFALIGNIVIANLLIGLTVSKTEELLKVATIIRLEKTVDQVSVLEKLIQFSGKTFGIRKHKVLAILDEFSQKRGPGNQDEASKWKIFVKPNSNQGEERSVFKKVGDFNPDTAHFNKSYSTWLYEIQGAGDVKLPFTVPERVVKNTIQSLREKEEQRELELAQEEAQAEEDLKQLFEELDEETAKIMSVEEASSLKLVEHFETISKAQSNLEVQVSTLQSMFDEKLSNVQKIMNRLAKEK